MKILTWKTILFVSVSVIGASFALRQNVAEGQTKPVLATEPVEAQLAGGEAANATQVREKQLEESRRQVDIARARARTGATLPGAGYSTVYGSRWPSRSGGAASVLVIPSAEMEAKDLLAINEDINVMSRIFETNLQQARISLSGGSLFARDSSHSSLFNMLSIRGSNSIQSLYLQGYGVVFLMKVEFPLSPLRRAQEPNEAEEDEEGDKVWDDARRQLYEPEKIARRKNDETSEEYDAEKVENLRTTLIAALKHASNMRNLKTDELVIVTISGSYGYVSGVTTTITKSGQVIVHDKNRKTTRIVNEPQAEDLGLSAPTVLTIRAKKVDIDSFAKGDLDLGQFRQRVQVISYPYLAAGPQRPDTLGYHMEDYVGLY